MNTIITMIIVMISILNLLNAFNVIQVSTTKIWFRVKKWNFVCILFFNRNQMENDRKINFNSSEVDQVIQIVQVQNFNFNYNRLIFLYILFNNYFKKNNPIKYVYCIYIHVLDALENFIFVIGVLDLETRITFQLFTLIDLNLFLKCNTCEKQITDLGD